MMDVHDSKATHSSSESGVQSVKLLDGSLGVAVSILLVSVSFAPHSSVKYIHWISFGKVVALYCTKEDFLWLLDL